MWPTRVPNLFSTKCFLGLALKKGELAVTQTKLASLWSGTFQVTGHSLLLDLVVCHGVLILEIAKS